MDFLGTIKLVFRVLLARKGRSFLTILGIVIGVAGVIIIIALGAGAQSLILGQITKLGSDFLVIEPGKSNEKGPPVQIFGIVVTTLTNSDAEALKNSAISSFSLTLKKLKRPGRRGNCSSWPRRKLLKAPGT